MNNRLLITLAVIVAAAVSIPVPALAQSPVIGRWDGAIQLQRSEMTVSVTIEPDGDGGWMGSIEIPARRAEPLPLGNIFVDGEFVSFSVEGTSGDPAFAGTISGGRRFAGLFSEGDVTFPFQLTRRTGVPDYMFIVPSTDAALEGTWHGVLDTRAVLIQFELRVDRAPNGIVTATLDSPDESVTGLTVDSLTMDGSRVRMTVAPLGATYQGTLIEGDNRITGTWRQGSARLALVFERDD